MFDRAQVGEEPLDRINRDKVIVEHRPGLDPRAWHEHALLPALHTFRLRDGQRKVIASTRHPAEQTALLMHLVDTYQGTSDNLRRRWREQRMDVGRAARRRPQRHAAVPDRPGPASRHPRPDADRDPATTAPGRARPAHLARPRSDPATTTRPAEPAGRPGPAAGTPRTHLTAQPYPNEQGPGDTDPDVGCFCTPTPTRTMQRQRSRRPEQDHSVSGGSRSDH